jgi:hypothetical protein
MALVETRATPKGVCLTVGAAVIGCHRDMKAIFQSERGLTASA